MKKTITLLISLFLLSPAFALDLDSAKAAGLIGEQVNGYLGIVSKPTKPEVESLVKNINSKRKQKYQDIAKQNGVDLKVVEKQSGKMLVDKTSAGQYINTGNSWNKK